MGSLRALIAEKGLLETQASQILGLSETELDWLLLHGGWGDYSLGQLLGFINSLNRNVRIIIDGQDAIGETAKTLVLTA